MALFNWTPDLSVKVTEIDRQHQKLIGIINGLHDAMSKGKGRDVVGRSLDDLVSYTSTHFKFEERYFDQYGYPDAPAHKAEHVNFVKKIAEFKTGFDDGKIGLSLKMMNFLTDWLRKHIKGTDAQYSGFFNEKGLK